VCVAACVCMRGCVSGDTYDQFGSGIFFKKAFFLCVKYLN
jgi:hypothetical protein